MKTLTKVINGKEKDDTPGVFEQEGKMRSVKSGVRSYHNHMSRNKVLLVFAAVLIFFNIIVFNDSCFYSQPICRIVSIETTQQPDVVGDLGTSESAYRQKLVCKAINGTQHDVDAASTTSRMTASADNTFTIENDYTFSRYNDTKYHKGDYLFLREVKTDNAGNITSAVIDGQKRDYFLSILLSAVIFGAVLTAGARGAAFAMALAANIGVLAAGFACFQAGVSFIFVTAAFLVIFPFISLMLCIGKNEHMKASLICTYAVTGVLAAVYCLLRRLSPNLDYTLQDYVRNGTLDIDLLLSCGTIIGSLGAIMDTSISLTSGAAEILRRTPEIDDASLRESLRDIGIDVTGTMINVLFYTYMAGRIPMCIAQLANGMPVFVMFRYYMPFELIRFLTGAVGIALTTIVSEWFIVKHMKKHIDDKSEIVKGVSESVSVDDDISKQVKL